MKIIKLKTENQFGLAPLTFAEIKAIRDACKEYGNKKGSKAALEIATAIEKELENLTV